MKEKNGSDYVRQTVVVKAVCLEMVLKWSFELIVTFCVQEYKRFSEIKGKNNPHRKKTFSLIG